MQKYLLIALGGALGSLARFWVGSTVASRLGTKFPYGTFVINLTACVIIGFSLAFLGKEPSSVLPGVFWCQSASLARTAHFQHSSGRHFLISRRVPS